MGLKPSLEILEKERLKSPGPGQYSPNIEPLSRSPPKFSIGTSQRIDFTNRKNALKEPGPGNYTPTDRFVKTNPQAWVIGSEKQRPGTTSTSPGPG